MYSATDFIQIVHYQLITNFTLQIKIIFEIKKKTILSKYFMKQNLNSAKFNKFEDFID